MQFKRGTSHHRPVAAPDRLLCHVIDAENRGGQQQQVFAALTAERDDVAAWLTS
ncbi:MAG: hypothetical protein KME20_27050 [Kaiparowitsia implicata GSE-PSE-MK54-09C]|nr:hypothetical protein [Kaiparowitsia implicata GSE-PSE-MK54-09C]